MSVLGKTVDSGKKLGKHFKFQNQKFGELNDPKLIPNEV